MKRIFTLFLLSLSTWVAAQTSTVTGQLLDDAQEAIMFANVVLYDQATEALVKVETSDENGKFKLSGIPYGTYFLKATYVGYEDLVVRDLVVQSSKTDLSILNMSISSVQLETTVVTAQRALVEIKPDRTVFNVEGTINSVGENALDLLRKAPGVLVDNNNNVSVLSRSGVLIYVDGKRLPLSGDDLSNYLQNIQAEQIDKIDIISNPGAKYEAEGNAGIIDIRMKKDKNLGANGTLSTTASQGIKRRGNVGLSGNYRNKTMNIFGNLGANGGIFYNEMAFLSYQNGLVIDDFITMDNMRNNANLRIGTDFFLSSKSTLGFLVNANVGETGMNSFDRSLIGAEATANIVDSILIANNTTDNNNSQNTYNINYVYLDGQKKLNIDADYGRYRNDSYFDQPNRYFNATETELLTEVLTEYETPTDIDIYTFKVDYETPFLGGQFGIGTKYSQVATDNTYLFYDVIDGNLVRDDGRSNNFVYDEKVYAGYLNYARQLSQKVNLSAGLRVETTDSNGELTAFDPDKQEPPSKRDYTNLFPNVGLTYVHSPMHMWSANFGRRINRPDYNVLNPFKIQISELSFSKGNAFLRPEIVNNMELGYTYKYMYNFKLAYSRTLDQITRLIGPDDSDPRAGFISWDNIATQTLYSFNVSAPFQPKKWWSFFVNLSAGYQDNQAEYENGATIDVQAFNYNIYQQSTFSLPQGFKFEVSGWFNGPGIWGGVFVYDPSWSLNMGLQKKFLNDQLNVKVSVNDIFFQAGWSGESKFNGLTSTGWGNWDSRRGTIAVSYNFGNSNVKSRKRNVGLESETRRLGGDGQGN